MTRWRVDGHMVLDDRSGATISCLGPVAASNAEAWGAALAQRVAIVLNDGDRPSSWTAAFRTHAGRLAKWGLAPAVPAVLVVAVLHPELRAGLLCATGGLTAGFLLALPAVWGARRNAEASQVRKDIALEVATGDYPVVSLPPERPVEQYDWATAPDELELRD